MKRALGSVLIAVSGLAFVIYLLGLLDPHGTKMADDDDPFGRPDPWYVPAAGMAVSAIVAGIGGWLVFYNRNSKRSTV